MRKWHYIGAFNGILIDLLSHVYISHPAELLRCPPVQSQLPAQSPASPSPPPSPPPGTCTWPPPATHVMCILIQMRRKWMNRTTGATFTLIYDLLHPTRLQPPRAVSSPGWGGGRGWRTEIVLMNCAVWKARVKDCLRTEREPCCKINRNLNGVWFSHIFIDGLPAHAQCGSSSSKKASCVNGSLLPSRDV